MPSDSQLSTTTNERLAIQETALDWQKIGVYAPWAELHGAHKGAAEGRMSELIGRAAVAGEQLGLAWTFEQEVQRWCISGSRADAGRAMATRALAECCGYYLIAAAHGLGNLTVRTLMLAPAAASILRARRPDAKRFPCFSNERAAWPPLNAKLAGHCMEAAVATGESAAHGLSSVLAGLVNDQQWVALVDRRDNDFHRWRPQGLPNGGVPRRSLWVEPSVGTRSLSVGPTFYDPVDHEALCRASSTALDTLGGAMARWLKMWPAALKAVGVPVFKIDD